MAIWTLVLSSVYHFLPAYVANMAPTVAAAMKLPLGIPIGEKAFGRHKTVRGMIAGLLGAFLMLLLQRWLQGQGMAESWRLMDYESANLIAAALLFGGGALLGDAFKSFCKRRAGRPEGSAWPPFDQLDFVVGALLFTLPAYPIPLRNVAVILVLTPALHLLVNMLAYALRIKKVWW